MVSAIISRVVILVFGLLYPAYNSYKAVKTKNVKEYVKWMMYWIVFAFFTCVETFADLFVSWIPFYYELKILFVLWLLSPATKGSSYLYRKFIHPQLSKKEKEIDSYITKASDEGYSALLKLGSRGLNYATDVVVKTAITGQSKVVEHLKKSYSLSDLSKDGQEKAYQEESIDGDDEPDLDNRIIEESYMEEMQQEEDNRNFQRRSVAGDLYSVQEGEDHENMASRGQPRAKKVAYSHKELLLRSDSAPSTPTGSHRAIVVHRRDSDEIMSAMMPGRRRRQRRKPITMEHFQDPHAPGQPALDPQ